MRVLVSTTAGSGHFGPMIPIARACAKAGHEVAVAAPGSFRDHVTRAGFAHLPFPDVPAGVMGAVFGRIAQLPTDQANQMVLQEVFGRLDAQAALPTVTEIITDWTPDIVLRETCELASLVAAERAGIPQVQVAIGMGRPGGDFVGVLDEPLKELSARAGLPAARGAELLLDAATFTSVPALLDGEDLQPADTDPQRTPPENGRVWRFRDGSVPDAGRLPPPWGHLDSPLVYVSYGSVTATVGQFGALYPLTLKALAELPVRVLMTTGDGLDPATLEPIPSNAHVERWWPQAEVMPLAAATIGHGGFGTTMMALAAGVPQVVVPLFAFDQFVNASRVAGVGAGIPLLGGQSAADQLPAAVAQLLGEPTFVRHAQAMAGEIAALPEVATCPPVLEELAGSG